MTIVVAVSTFRFSQSGERKAGPPRQGSTRSLGAARQDPLSARTPAARTAPRGAQGSDVALGPRSIVAAERRPDLGRKALRGGSGPASSRPGHRDYVEVTGNPRRTSPREPPRNDRAPNARDAASVAPVERVVRQATRAASPAPENGRSRSRPRRAWRVGARHTAPKSGRRPSSRASSTPRFLLLFCHQTRSTIQRVDSRADRRYHPRKRRYSYRRHG